MERALYRTRRAAFLFRQYVIDWLGVVGFTRVSVAAQFFFHVGRQILLVIHGDDFAAAAVREQLDWLDEVLGQFFLIKVIGRVGPPEEGGQEEGFFTKRRVGWNPKGFSWEADGRHIDRVVAYSDRGARLRKALGDDLVVEGEQRGGGLAKAL